MELRHLRYFVAVAEERSFSRAAERLGIKQPPLSTQVRQLEKEMGTPLFRRLTRGVELTAAGKLFLEQTRTVLRQLDQAKIDVKRRARGETGQISVGAADACYFHPRVHLIASEFFKSYPDIVTTVEENNTATLIASLHAGKLDASFVRCPTAEFDDLALELVAEEDTVAALPERHPLHGSSSVALTSFEKETIVLIPRALNTGLYDSVIAACRHAGFAPVLGREASSIIAMIAMVADGFGATIVPQSLSRLRLDGVIYLPIRGHRPAAPIYFAYRRDERSPTVRNLVAIVRRVSASVTQTKTSASAASLVSSASQLKLR